MSSNANVKADTYLTELTVSTLMSAVQKHTNAVLWHLVPILLVVIRVPVQMVILEMAVYAMTSMSALVLVTIVQLKLFVKIHQE